jgi:hypothetical protein
VAYSCDFLTVASHTYLSHTGRHCVGWHAVVCFGAPEWFGWDPSIEGERAREPRGVHPSLTRRSPWLTLLARWECLKRHGVGERESELGADFNSLVLPRAL